MIKNFFLVAYRNLVKNKAMSFLNISGLAIGILVCLVIGVWLQRELSFDNFHPNGDKIFRIANTFKSESESFSQAGSGAAYGAHLTTELPSIKAACRVFGEEFKVKSKDNLFIESNAAVVDSNFFSFFGFKLLRGDPDQVKIDANHLFEYNFLDKQWEIFYRDDQKRQVIFLVIAALTILIACLGLFGLATYAAEQRIREIGIRKVLGASVPGLVKMLSKDFIKLVLIASVLAIPVAWWMMNSWLIDFAYRTKIYWWVFVIAGALSLLVALLTVGLKALKAAIANPVKSLRTE